MDTLPDDVIADILRRLPPSSAAAAAALVSRRFLHLHRRHRHSLSLPSSHLHLLPHYPSLRRLRLLSSPPSLLPVAAAAPSVVSLSLASFPILSLPELLSFRHLRDLSLHRPSHAGGVGPADDPAELRLESMSVTGLTHEDVGLGWLWRSCGSRLRRLRLRSSAGTGDSFQFFACALPGLLELELRACRGAFNEIMALVAAHAAALCSLLVHDGGSREALFRFLYTAVARPCLKALEFRLPLDLYDDHLLAAGANLPMLAELRLQSCCLVTGSGLRWVASRVHLEELALINCEAVEGEPERLTTLAQSLKRLKRLDLSYNDKLGDNELRSLLASCGNLVEVRLKGCKELTGSAMAAVRRFCKRLRVVDVLQCVGIGVEDIELLVLALPELGRIAVEEMKISDKTKSWMLLRSMQLG